MPGASFVSLAFPRLSSSEPVQKQKRWTSGPDQLSLSVSEYVIEHGDTVLSQQHNQLHGLTGVRHERYYVNKWTWKICTWNIRVYLHPCTDIFPQHRQIKVLFLTCKWREALWLSVLVCTKENKCMVYFFQCRYTLLEEEIFSQAVILRKSVFTKTVKTFSRIFSVQIPQNHRVVRRDLEDHQAQPLWHGQDLPTDV